MPNDTTDANLCAPPRVEFGENLTPLAVRFEDIYFAVSDGLAESRYVFLDGAKVQARWQEKSQFVIAETGFGTGLNFLASWQAWRDDPKRPARLYYFSVEKHPLKHKDLKTALSRWPELDALNTDLLRNWPLPSRGFHTLHFNGGQVTLVLMFDEVKAALAEADFCADAWFLDGFVPSKNPAMWTPDVLKQIWRLSQTGTRFATFSAAGEVRRNLQAVGFVVEKRKGFGKKREMLVGRKSESTAQTNSYKKPWFNPVPPVIRDRKTPSALVIGAGIAGAQIARALAERGWQITVWEADKCVANGASGNRLGVFAPKLTAQPSLGERFYLTAWQYQLRQFDWLQTQGCDELFTPCGVMQIAHNPRELARVARVWKHFPKTIARGLEFDPALLGEKPREQRLGYFFEQAGAIAPRKLVTALLAHESIVVKLNASVPEISTAKGWMCLREQENADALVIATGAALAAGMADFLPVTPVRGQSSLASCSTPLGQVLGHEGYVIPSGDGNIVFGATFDRGNDNTGLRETDDQRNAEALTTQLPGLEISDIRSGHAAARATTPDRWPVVGAVPDWQWAKHAYADLQQGKPAQHYPPMRYLTGVYLLGGLGARGLSTSAYCAQLLASEISGEPPQAENTLHQAMHPVRFLIRRLSRRGQQAHHRPPA